MALININAEVKSLTRVLERVATALEHIAFTYTGVRVGELAKIKKTTDNEFGVAYADDESTQIREVRDLRDGRLPGGVIDVEEIELTGIRAKLAKHWGKGN